MEIIDSRQLLTLDCLIDFPYMLLNWLKLIILGSHELRVYPADGADYERYLLE